MPSSDTTLSVVIRTYNRADMLAEAIDSVRTQTVRPLEIVVVDDASTDHTVAVIERYQALDGPPVRLVRFPENRGMDRAKQAGVDAAEGTWVALLDSDDIWLPNHLEQGLAAIGRHDGAQFAFARYGLMDDQQNPLVAPVPEPRLEVAHAALLRKRPVVHPSRSFFRKAAIEAIGGIPLCGSVGDWVMNVLISFRYPDGVLQLPEQTIWMRIHPGQSYGRPGEVRDALLRGTDYIFDHAPEMTARREAIRAMNLTHAAMFFWQAPGGWLEAWNCLFWALREDPAVVRTRDFWAAGLKVLVPPPVGSTIRQAKRVQQARKARRAAADLPT